MELQEAKDKFVHTWGTLATQWGINRTMSQIHALLLLSEKALNADQIMEQLTISRGNVNMNLRELMSWGLINKQLLQGERKEYFTAEKDIWKVARLIAKRRKRREIEPVIEVMDEIKNAIKPDSPEKKEFLKVINDISKVGGFADSTMTAIIKSEESWLASNLLKAFK
jgi:DNA-binding transcriptional regulator GbsR (MarR family)